MISVTVNGKMEQLENPLTVKSYLEGKAINPKGVVVELNYLIPGREDWDQLLLKDGDNLEIVKFIGGG